MSDKVDLRVDWCSYQAAKYAVEHWHYSRTMPVSKACFIGVWEQADFIGSVVFSWGANPNLSKAYGIEMIQCTELVRIALREHKSQVSRIAMFAIKLFRTKNPGARLLVSFADQREGHTGAIYQAMNWIYAGETNPKFDFILGDKILQRRSYTGRNFGGGRLRPPHGAEKIESPPKYRYLYPLDKAMARQIEPLRQPYPKRLPCGPGEIDNAPETNQETGGASPTGPLSDSL